MLSLSRDFVFDFLRRYNTPLMTSSPTNPKPSKSRREILEDFASKNPGDAFSRYGLAMECAQLGDLAAAESHFKSLLEAHPGYVAGYFHYGQLLAKLERTSEARQILSAGIAQAARLGDGHARSEMQAALDELNLA
jgi:tetratricopeptide (TPR) repeat protein